MSHRTQITLTDRQYERLRAESSQSGRSLADLVRSALDRTYGGGSSSVMRRALESSFGAWRDAPDGTVHVEGLRKGLGRRIQQ